MPNPNNEKLAAFVEDDVMFHAVKAIILSKCDLNTIDSETSVADLSYNVKAWLVAREIIQDGFKELEKYRKHPAGDKGTDNPNNV